MDNAAASAAQSQPGQVFISYARVDARWANEIEQAITLWGYRSWMDRQRLGGGQNWTVELERAIAQSAALLVILTPAALASPMVRREYQQALACNIPVILAQMSGTVTPPPELTHAPRINMRRRRDAGALLYLALGDHGATPQPPAHALESVNADAILRAIAGRAAADWRVFVTPWRAYIWRTVVSIAPMTLVIVSLNLLGPLWRALASSHALYALANLMFVLAMIASALFALRLPIYWLILWRVSPRELIVLTPESCAAFLMRSDRLRIGSSWRLYQYRWATAARIERGHWGSLRITFEGSDGQAASLRLPASWPGCGAIARQIVADVAAYQRQAKPGSIAAPSPALSAPMPIALPVAPIAPVAAVAPPTPASAPTLYTVLAPRSANAVIANVQAWLGGRDILPAEMLWDAESGGLLLPTARGAAQSRFVLFVDAPAITYSPRCRAILDDLRRQGKVLIPLRVGKKPAAPSEWSTLQWVDCSPAISRERSLLSLCDTLDRLGMPLTPRLGAQEFDSELALARGVYQRLPSGWRAYLASSAYQRASYRGVQRTLVSLGLLFFLLAGGLIVAAVLALASLAPSQLSGWSAYLLATLVVALGVVIVALLLRRLVMRLIAQLRAKHDLTRDGAVPECLVITPDGIAFHMLNAANSALMSRWTRDPLLPDAPPAKYLIGGYPFSQLQAVEGRTGVFGAPLLRLQTVTGETVDLSLAAFINEAETAITQAMEACAASRARTLSGAAATMRRQAGV